MNLLRKLYRRAVIRLDLPDHVERIISGQGTPDDTFAKTPARHVYYLKFDKWLVRPRYVLWFLRRCQIGNVRLRLPIVYVKAVSHSAAYTQRYPVLRVKGETSKVSLFDLERRVKRAVWADAKGYQAALAAVNHFSRTPASVPPVITRDDDSLAMEEGLVGPLFRRTNVVLSDAVPILIELNASCPRDTSPLPRYVVDNATHIERMGKHLDDVSRKRLVGILQRLQRLAREHPERGVPMVQVHNDLGRSNMIREGTKLYFIDFDESFRASVWYDLVLFSFWPGSIGFDDLTRFVTELNQRAGYRDVAAAESLQWSCLLFTVDYCRYVSSRVLGETGQPAPRLASTLRNRLRFLVTVLSNDVWSRLDGDPGGRRHGSGG